MVASAIWKKQGTSEFFKDDQNCTSPKDECNLKSLKNSRMYVFPNCTRNHTITYSVIYMKKVCSRMRAQVTCEIVNFNINTFSRKSTKNANHFVTCKCLNFFVLFSARNSCIL